MAKTFMQMVEDAKSVVGGVSPAEARRRQVEDNAVIVDVRDASDVPSTGLPPGGLNISLGMLPVKADSELPEALREQKLQDRSTPVVVTCQLGLNAARGAQVLKEMGFSDVTYMEGGMNAWAEADLPTD